jgi:hypothetical protein
MNVLACSRVEAAQPFRRGAIMDEATSEIVFPKSQPSEADARASLAALREDVQRIADDLARLAQAQREAANSVARDLEAELRRQMRDDPVRAALALAFFGYLMGRRRRRRNY